MFTHGCYSFVPFYRLTEKEVMWGLLQISNTHACGRVIGLAQWIDEFVQQTDATGSIPGIY